VKERKGKERKKEKHQPFFSFFFSFLFFRVDSTLIQGGIKMESRSKQKKKKGKK